MKQEDKAPLIRFLIENQDKFEDLTLSDIHDTLRRQFKDITEDEHGFTLAVTKGLLNSFGIVHRRGKGVKSNINYVTAEEFEDLLNRVKRLEDEILPQKELHFA